MASANQSQGNLSRRFSRTFGRICRSLKGQDSFRVFERARRQVNVNGGDRSTRNMVMVVRIYRGQFRRGPDLIDLFKNLDEIANQLAGRSGKIKLEYGMAGKKISLIPGPRKRKRISRRRQFLKIKFSLPLEVTAFSQFLECLIKREGIIAHRITHDRIIVIQ